MTPLVEIYFCGESYYIVVKADLELLIFLFQPHGTWTTIGLAALVIETGSLSAAPTVLVLNI